MKQLIKTLRTNHSLPKADMVTLISEIVKNEHTKDRMLLFSVAQSVQEQHFGKSIFKRGLLEITNHCKNNCYYCGIRRDNKNILRYRLTESEILDSCAQGYKLGFRTFVVQGGEDLYFTPERIRSLVQKIKANHPDCAITLSLGEAEKDVYQSWYDTGADRYLLRHETADPTHYAELHPEELSANHRKNCLYQLKAIGYQVGTGFMVGSPGQTTDHLVADLEFIQELGPQMVGIGPFIAHCDTIYKDAPSGSVELTLVMLAILRLMLPNVLLPATTALGTAATDGRERGILAGANVVMPNLTPVAYREHYVLYDNKICTGEEAAQCSGCLALRMQSIGYEILVNRGDYA